MRIGVISDTHIPETTNEIPSQIYGHFKGVDLILHAGDLVDLRVLDELRKLAPVRAVCGNMDPPKIKECLPKMDVIEVGKFKLGLTHGSGLPIGLRRRVGKVFRNEKVDVIVFGHSHSPVNVVERGILFFNPGSPTDEIFAPYRSCGILEIDSEVRGRIIRLKDI